MLSERDDLSTAVDTVPAGASCRTWTLRLDNHAHHHDVVRLGEAPLYLELSCRATKTAPVTRVGIFRLELYGLLQKGFIRSEGSATTTSDVRLRVVRAENEHFYLQARNSGPRLRLDGAADDNIVVVPPANNKVMERKLTDGLIQRIPLPSPQAPVSRTSLQLGTKSRIDWASEMARRVGMVPEAPEYLTRVHAWRTAWRPQRIRVLLLAESHVAEVPGDTETEVHLPSEVRPSVTVPRGFCRLVYCLGYGENPICGPRAPLKNTGGTWQYWDIFGAVASVYDGNVPASMPRRSQTDLITRLQWKLAVLETMRRAGVWLEDASALALYSPGGGRLAKGRSYLQLVRASFENVVWPSIAADRPEQVWVIGHGVGQALDGLPQVDAERIISQPQDRDYNRFRGHLARLLRSLPCS